MKKSKWFRWSNDWEVDFKHEVESLVNDRNTARKLLFRKLQKCGMTSKEAQRYTLTSSDRIYKRLKAIHESDDISDYIDTGENKGDD